MPPKSKTPHNGGASQFSFGGYIRDEYKVQPLHRQAALTLLCKCPELPRKQAGFLGHVCVARELTSSQRDWLAKLLKRNHLPQLTEGNEQ